ncbi:syntaxin-22-like [Canna indica]|uniref:Syntaxin-22-like n=1 Tax=Canna indica TaxID=4628 RepID=A0AAQ3JU57_9LILI|nr:syntaxin-22-like [Canna indica]
MSFQDLESGRLLTGWRDTVNEQQDPAQAVAAGLFQITTSVRNFERLVNTIGTPKDTPELREKLHNTRLQIGQLVKDTSAKLKQASETDHRADVSANKKIADAKLARDFENILREFQKLQRLSAERETAFSPLVAQPVVFLVHYDLSMCFGYYFNFAFMYWSYRQEVLLLDNEIVFNEAVIEEREQGIQEIQKQIGEVNEIFKDLAVLVHDQGVVIDDINSHVENSHAATAQGKAHLKKAAKSQKSNSSLMCLLLVIFGIILLIVIIVMAA